MTATKPTGGLPVLYAEPLPTEPREKVREQLRRVKRLCYGSNLSLTYTLEGKAGHWRLAPVDYFGGKHKGRKGPYVVREYRQAEGMTYPSYNVPAEIERVFDSEADAWEFVTAVHAERVEAQLPKLIRDEVERYNGIVDGIRTKLTIAAAERDAWASWLPADVIDPRD